jgi:hypothetical protein
MPKVSKRHEVWVCVECLLAHHFGADGVENPDPRWDRKRFLESMASGEWSDWDCVSHDYESSWCDACDSDEDGTRTFSWTPCECCGNPAGGSRHRFSRSA